MKKFLKNLKLHEDVVGLALGAAIVVLSGLLLWNYFRTVNQPSEFERTMSTATELNLAAEGVDTGTTLAQAASVRGEYTIAAGDSLWKIAKNNYGSGYAWTKIYEANKEVLGKNPGILKAGTKINLPEIAENVIREHKVARGETLWSVASNYCQSGFAWNSIATANSISEPKDLKVGTNLKIVCPTPTPNPVR